MVEDNNIQQIDDLTGLPGWAALQNYLKNPPKSLMTSDHVCLVLADVAEVGRINQKYGIEAGDQIIQFAAKELRRVFDLHGLVFRRSGDEFAIVVSDMPETILAETVKKISALNFQLTETNGQIRNIPVQLYLSCCHCKDAGTRRIDELYLKAREALENAKKRHQPISSSGQFFTEPNFFPQRTRIAFREAELKKLFSVYNQTELGKGHLVVVRGAAGIGKTKLLNHFITSVREQFNPYILTGNTHPVQIPSPYQAIKKALLRFATLKPIDFYGTLNKLPDQSIQELYQFLPELDVEKIKSVRFDVPYRQFKYAIFDSVARFLKLLTDQKVVVVWLDDFQDADKGSWELIEFLSPLTHHQNLLIVVSIRDSSGQQLPSRPDSTERLDSLVSATEVNVLSLSPFDRDQTRDFCSNYKFLKRLPDKSIDYIYEISQGNPLFILELAKYIAATPRIMRKIEKGTILSEALDIPVNIQDTVLGELSILTKEELEFAKRISIIDNEFNLVSIKLAVPLNAGHIQSLTEKLLLKQVIIEDENNQEHYQFAHPMLRSVLYHNISQKKRRSYHLYFAKSLEKDALQMSDPTWLSDHYYLAGEWEPAYHYTLTAAIHAKQLYAYETAYQLYSRAREIAKILGHEAHFAEMVQKEGEMLEHMGQYEAAYIRLVKAAKLMESAKNIYGTALIYHLIARVEHYRGNLESSLKILNKAKTLISDDVSLFGMILGEECWVYRIFGDYDKSIDAGEKSLEILQKSAPKRETGFVLSNLGDIYYRMGNVKKAQMMFSERLVISRQIGDRQSEALSLLSLAELEMMTTDLDAAHKNLEEALRIAREIHHRPTMAKGLGGMAYYYLESDQYEKAKPVIDEAFGIVDECEYHFLRPLLYLLKAIVYKREGNLKSSYQMAKSAYKLSNSSRAMEMEGLSLAYLGLINLDLDHQELGMKQIQDAQLLLDKVNLFQLLRIKIRIYDIFMMKGYANLGKKVKEEIAVIQEKMKEYLTI